jgi:hypothetical protein
VIDVYAIVVIGEGELDVTILATVTGDPDVGTTQYSVYGPRFSM